MKTRSRRVEFKAGPGAERSRCRYCAAEVLWDRKVYGAPLHLATARREGRDFFLESHVPYCPGRDRIPSARRGPRPKASHPCAACDRRVLVKDRPLCHECWGLVPAAVRAAVEREWRRRPRDPLRCGTVVRQATIIARQARAEPDPGLFD